MTEKRLKEYAARIETALDGYIPARGLAQQTVADAMRYSLLGGGKRLRGALVLEFAHICGGNEDAAMPYACAIEMIHAYSLIHDDLPCMDNDDYRRGKLTNHKVYGEAMATLAGDGLLNRAFEIILEPGKLEATRALQAARELANAAGLFGMLGGQCIDVENDGRLPELDSLRAMYAMKTGALIKAACRMGCIAAGAGADKLAAAAAYADSVGLAFQIRDDMLDIEGSATELGKQTGADIKQGKTTYPAILGLDECRKIITRLTAEASAALTVFEERGFLCALAEDMAVRTK